MLIKITDQPIDVREALEYVRHESCGAVTMFEGDIRNTNEGESVAGLTYEVYDELLRNEMEKIGAEMRARWSVHEIAVIQRTGWLNVGDIGIVISVSSAHRRDALDALSHAIEEFKKRAPVWKKEKTTKGDKWINWQRHS